MWGKRECADIGRLLWDYAEGRLTEAAWERVERHLQGCRDCRELAEDYRRTARHLAAYREQPVSSLPSAWSELRQSLVAGRQPVAEPRDRRRLPALAWGS